MIFVHTNIKFMAQVKFVNEVVLKISDLEFYYNKNHKLFTNFNLSLKKGEIVSILGSSGSGKSTLFELISGFLKPKKGLIEKESFSQVFQDPYSSFHPSYSIISQIKEVADLAEHLKLCQKMHFDPNLLEKKPRELSGGELQRASIIRALLMKPKLLLADEPTSALDNIVQLQVMKELLLNLSSFGLLLITHDEALASWCSDKIIRLN